MNNINPTLQKEITRECMIKSAVKNAQANYTQTQNDARRTIELLKDKAELKRDNYLNSYE